MALTSGQMMALRNLARKQAGEAVEWIKIADALALTEQGFAERRPGGWRITASGEALLKAQPQRTLDGGDGI
jgi:hypothetical protein